LVKSQEPAPPQPPAARPPAPADPGKAREDQIKRWENAAVGLRAVIAGQEREVRMLVESHSLGDLDADKARLQRTLSKLDDEVFGLEKEILDSQVQLELLQKRIAGNRAGPVPAEVIEAEIARHPVAAELTRQRELKQRALAELSAVVTGADHPAVVALKQEIGVLDKKLEDVRSRVRAGVLESLRAAALKPLKERAEDLEDKLAVTAKVLEQRRKDRAFVEAELARQAKAAASAAGLLREIEPQREQLRRIETQLLDLRLNRELGTPAPARTDGTEAKLDRLIREVEELRREVRELRKP
jgi:hypothetical protein